MAGLKTCIRINAFERKVEEVQVRIDDLQDIYRWVSGPEMKVSIVQPFYPFQKSDVVLVDENGLLRKPMPRFWFQIEGFAQAMVGNGLVCGVYGSAWGKARQTVKEISEQVRWYTLHGWPHSPKLIPPTDAELKAAVPAQD